MEKETEIKKSAGDVIPLTSQLVYQVMDEEGKLINCPTLNEALLFSYLIKIWGKMSK